MAKERNETTKKDLEKTHVLEGRGNLALCKIFFHSSIISSQTTSIIAIF